MSISEEPKIIDELRWGNTWRLFFYSILTLGIFPAYYIQRQSRVINEQATDGKSISAWLTASILIISYGSALLFIGYLFVDEDHPVARWSNLFDLVYTLGYIIWGYAARERLNTLLSLDRASRFWFDGLWTFLFTPLYFNYQVNKIAFENQRAERISLSE